MPEPEPPTHTPRLSLTKRQLETPAAVDLLQLLQSVTADGHLVEEEIHALHEWLAAHADEDLPATRHLRDALDRVLADGTITPAERTWLQKQIEAVLPPDARDGAVRQRRGAEHAARVEQTERAKAEAAANRPIAHFDFMVAGAFYEDRPAVIRAAVEDDVDVFLIREPTNPYSRNAVLICLADGRDIGYMPEREAKEMAPHLDGGARYEASIKKVLSGQRGLIPVVWGELYPSAASIGVQGLPAGMTPRAPIGTASPAPASPKGARAPGPPPQVWRVADRGTQYVASSWTELTQWVIEGRLSPGARVLDPRVDRWLSLAEVRQMAHSTRVVTRPTPARGIPGWVKLAGFVGVLVVGAGIIMLTGRHGSESGPPVVARSTATMGRGYKVLRTRGKVRIAVIDATARNEAALRLIGDQLRSDFGSESFVLVNLFDNVEAAGLYDTVVDSGIDALGPQRERFYDLHHVAIYTKNSRTGFHRLQILGSGPTSHATDINY